MWKIQRDSFCCGSNGNRWPMFQLMPYSNSSCMLKSLTSRQSPCDWRRCFFLCFRLNYLLGGLDPTGYHTVNVLLHALCCVLLTRLCEQVLFYSPRLSALAGLLFATHPIHTEAVSIINVILVRLLCLYFPSYIQILHDLCLLLPIVYHC